MSDPAKDYLKSRTKAVGKLYQILTSDGDVILPPVEVACDFVDAVIDAAVAKIAMQDQAKTEKEKETGGS